MSSITIDTNRINSFQNISINNSKDNTKNNNILKGNSNIASKQNKKENGLIQNLLKQKQELNEEKQVLDAKKMDAKEKKLKMDELNQKIKDVDSQIQQLKIQEKQEELQKKQAKEEIYTKNNYETKADVILSASLSELIKAKGSKETIHLLKDSKNRQTIEAEYIKPNNIPNSYDNNRLSKIGASIANINMSIYKKIGDLNKSAERIQAKTELALKQLNNNNSDNDLKVNNKDTLNGVLKYTNDNKSNSKLQDTNNESKSTDDNNSDKESKNNKVNESNK